MILHKNSKLDYMTYMPNNQVYKK